MALTHGYPFSGDSTAFTKSNHFGFTEYGKEQVLGGFRKLIRRISSFISRRSQKKQPRITA